MHLRFGPARRTRTLGGLGVLDARRLADAERALGDTPEGCRWLDERAVGDLELSHVFRTIDRTSTVIGAQALWRWLAAPATRLAATERRAAQIERFRDAGAREQVRARLAGAVASADAPYVPNLLWGRDLPRPALALPLALLAAFVTCALGAAWWPPLALGCIAIFIVDVLVDDWANLRVAHQARALEVLGGLLGIAARLEDPALAAELAPLRSLRRRIVVLGLRDPFGVLDAVRTGLPIRLLVLAACFGTLERERERLRRIVLAIGELDAAAAVAELRAERPDARMPELLDGEPRIVARGLVHPAIPDAVGNDLELVRGGMLVTGSNMAGKSTLLRAVAINAICAQAICTTFGSWRASLFSVHTAMQIADDTARGQSTFAVEVAAIGALVAEAAPAGARLPRLFVLDEPFRGTNPAVRVPIVVAVVEYLGARDVALVATHDLDVAAQVGGGFVRAYISDADHVLRPGIAPAVNAIELLARADYPAELLADIRVRAAGALAGLASAGAAR